MSEGRTVAALIRTLEALGTPEDALVVLEVDGRRVDLEEVRVEVWGAVVFAGSTD